MLQAKQDAHARHCATQMTLAAETATEGGGYTGRIHIGQSMQVVKNHHYALRAVVTLFMQFAGSLYALSQRYIFHLFTNL